MRTKKATMLGCGIGLGSLMLFFWAGAEEAPTTLWADIAAVYLNKDGVMTAVEYEGLEGKFEVKDTIDINERAEFNFVSKGTGVDFYLVEREGPSTSYACPHAKPACRPVCEEVGEITDVIKVLMPIERENPGMVTRIYFDGKMVEQDTSGEIVSSEIEDPLTFDCRGGLPEGVKLSGYTQFTLFEFFERDEEKVVGRYAVSGIGDFK
jgi:hypothetical protein